MTAKNTRKIQKRQQKNPAKANDSEDSQHPVSVVPLIVEHGLYTRQQVILALGISPNTLTDWMTQGPHPLKPSRRVARKQFFSGRRIINFLEGES